VKRQTGSKYRVKSSGLQVKKKGRMASLEDLILPFPSLVNRTLHELSHLFQAAGPLTYREQNLGICCRDRFVRASGPLSQAGDVEGRNDPSEGPVLGLEYADRHSGFGIT
jgi:hypothetical protein